MLNALDEAFPEPALDHLLRIAPFNTTENLDGVGAEILRQQGKALSHHCRTAFLNRRVVMMDSLKIVVPVFAEEALLAHILGVHHQPAQCKVCIVDGEGALLLPFVPVAHHDKRNADVDAVVGHAFDHHLVCLVHCLNGMKISPSCRIC